MSDTSGYGAPTTDPRSAIAAAAAADAARARIVASAAADAGQAALPTPHPISQGLSGVNEGIANTLGLPVDLMNDAVGLGMKGVNAVAGTNFQPSDAPVGGSQSIKNLMGAGSMITPPDNEPVDQFTRRVGQQIGANIIPDVGLAADAARPVATLAGSLGMGAASGVGAATADAVTNNNPVADAAGSMLGGVPLVARALATRAMGAPDAAAAAAVPTVPALKASAGALYDRAAQSGVVATPAQTSALNASMQKLATDQGLISPTGRVSTAYPKINAALNTFEDYSQGSMTVPQMQAVRQTLSDAAGSADSAEGRIGSMMLDQFDNFVAPLSPELTDARGLYARAMQGQRLETLRELAEAQSERTGRSLSSTLQGEYGGLNRQVIKGQARGVNDDLADAVSQVARGTTASRAFSAVGRAAPRGPVSAALTTGAPAILGTLYGGPEAGIGAAGVATAATAGAQGVANRMVGNQAAMAELLARNGVPVRVGAPLTPKMMQIAAALMAAQTANQSQ